MTFFKSHVEDTGEDSITKAFFELCEKLGKQGISASTYKIRLEILLKTNPRCEKLPGNITLVSTETTASNLIGQILNDHPVIIDETVCENCKKGKTVIQSCLSVCLTESDLSQLDKKLSELLQLKFRTCEQCGGVQSVKRTLCNTYLIIELVYMSSTDQKSDILKEYETKPCDLPLVITLNEVTYTLRGFLGFCGKTSSITSIGHYVAYVRRCNDTWELYDDTKDSKICVSPSKSVPCQVLVYTV
ncbi:uncharacterized protein LOC120350058 [Nilaparvata lugens]|uniref:uncharacterized protein LOC120350058 n=1 Tax=Nilaparvata lugens TaxID=108931 RepID=UPI00193EA8CD|nr:uncharacterized protein LOC120350058 [Nilaparvata lugens]